MVTEAYPYPCRYEASRGIKTGAFLPRVKAPVAVVWHTTGAGPLRRFLARPDKYEDPYDAAIHIYTRIMRPGPHFVVGQLPGQIIQVTPVDRTAWHVGRRKSWGYRSRWVGVGRYRWWAQRWGAEGLRRPGDLAGGHLWDGGQCNPNTIGVEIAPGLDGPRVLTRAGWQNVLDLGRVLSAEYGIPADRFHHVGHSDAHPKARTTGRGKPWDLDVRAWSPVEMERRLRAG